MLPLLLFFGHLADRFPYAHKLTLFLDLFLHFAVYLNLLMEDVLNNVVGGSDTFSPMFQFLVPLLRHDPILFAVCYGAICRHGDRDFCPVSRSNRLSHTGARLMRGFLFQQIGSTLGSLFNFLSPLNIQLVGAALMAGAFVYALIRFRDDEDYIDLGSNDALLNHYLRSCSEEYNNMAEAIRSSQGFLTYTYVLMGLLFAAFVASSMQYTDMISVYLHNVGHHGTTDILWVQVARNTIALLGLICLISWYWGSLEFATSDLVLVLSGATSVLIEFSLYASLYIFPTKPWLIFFGTMFAFSSVTHKAVLLSQLTREIQCTYFRPRILVTSFVFVFAMTMNVDCLQTDFVSQSIVSRATNLWQFFLISICAQLFVILICAVVLLLYYCRERRESSNSPYYHSVFFR